MDKVKRGISFCESARSPRCSRRLKGHSVCVSLVVGGPFEASPFLPLSPLSLSLPSASDTFWRSASCDWVILSSWRVAVHFSSESLPLLSLSPPSVYTPTAKLKDPESFLFSYDCPYSLCSPVPLHPPRVRSPQKTLILPFLLAVSAVGVPVVVLPLHLHVALLSIHTGGDSPSTFSLFSFFFSKTTLPLSSLPFVPTLTPHSHTHPYHCSIRSLEAGR